MPISDYLANKLLDHQLGKTSWTMPTVYVSLHTGDPGKTGASEVAGGSYARQQVAGAGWNAAASQLADNVNAINFTSMPACDVVAVGIWDALTTGNFLRGGWLSTTVKPFVCTDTSGNLIRSPSHGFSAGDRVAFEAYDAGSIPTGLSLGTLYYVIAGGLTSDDFAVSTTLGGAAVDITAAGAGKVRKVTVQTVSGGGTFTIGAGNLDVKLLG
mgnify:CR=1 FL=1